jgi:hypothetical protein
VEANITGGQGSRRAVAPSDDDDDISDVNFCVLLQVSKNKNSSETFGGTKGKYFGEVRKKACSLQKVVHIIFREANALGYICLKSF